VITLDIDGAPDIAARHGVRGVPLLMLFEGAQEVDRLVGAAPEPEPRLREWLEPRLPSPQAA
jgi:thioredoxin-like negative regulator of GroEL